MPDLRNPILAALAYFDVFRYPLTQEEIYLFLPVKCDRALFDFVLGNLLSEGFIYRFDTFYTLADNKLLAERRKAGNTRARQMIGIAKVVARILIRFPYVRGIAISGSLSKHFADSRSDIDLFIITAPNRLWIARTLMHGLKKLSYLFRKQHYFCMNYYIDETQLLIPEKNTYTATEIVTLIPLQDDGVFEQFYRANAWTNTYLPNRNMWISSGAVPQSFLLKNMVENVFNHSPGNRLDQWLQRITAARWAKKTARKQLDEKGSVMGMDCSRHCAKPHPGNYHEKLEEACRVKVEAILDRQFS